MQIKYQLLYLSTCKPGSIEWLCGVEGNESRGTNFDGWVRASEKYGKITTVISEITETNRAN